MIAKLVYFNLVQVHLYLAMDGCTAIIFGKICQIGFVQVGVVCDA